MVASPGKYLKDLRESRKWSQRDINVQSRGVLTNQQVSRLERDEIDNPPMSDLVLYGGLLGLTPNELATLYGYWVPPTAREAEVKDHPVLREVRRVLRAIKGKPWEPLVINSFEAGVALGDGLLKNDQIAPTTTPSIEPSPVNGRTM